MKLQGEKDLAQMKLQAEKDKEERQRKAEKKKEERQLQAQKDKEDKIGRTQELALISGAMSTLKDMAFNTQNTTLQSQQKFLDFIKTQGQLAPENNNQTLNCSGHPINRIETNRTHAIDINLNFTGHAISRIEDSRTAANTETKIIVRQSQGLNQRLMEAVTNLVTTTVTQKFNRQQLAA